MVGEVGGDLFGENPGVEASEDVHLPVGRVDCGVDLRTELPEVDIALLRLGGIVQSGNFLGGEHARNPLSGDGSTMADWRTLDVASR